MSLLATYCGDRSFTVLRSAEPGLVMVRARAGGSGALFNTGEMTVTRCSVRLEDGAIGHGYAQGRDRARAEVAARLDAVMQELDAKRVEPVVEALEYEIGMKAQTRQSKSVPTKVDFLTLVRGENA